MFIGESAGSQNAAMHESMTRVYEAAGSLLGIRGQSQLASVINESPQTVNNWESRGVSNRGAIKCARVIGCRSEWIMTGEGEMVGQSKPTASTGVSSQAAELAALFDLLPQDRVKRAIAFNAASAAILDVLQQH